MKKIEHNMLGLLVALALASTISTDISMAIEGQKSQRQNSTNIAENSKDFLYVDNGKYKGQSASINSKEGAKLFQENNCVSCHSIEGKGGCLAPPLDGIGGRRSKLFVESRITKDEKAIARFFKLYPYAELLEHPRLPSGQAKSISTYLFTLSDLAGGTKIRGHKVIQQEALKTPNQSLPSKTADLSKVAEGRLLFNDRSCLVCHSVRNMGGHFAPALDGISKRQERHYVSDRISAAEFFNEIDANKNNDPNEYNERGTVMPPSDLNPQEVESITDYLMSLP